MLTAALSVTYAGAAFCYGASPKAAGRATWLHDWASTDLLRLAGLLLLGLGFGIAIVVGPVGEAVLVWLTMGMAAFSLLVVAAPLVTRFVPVTVALALGIAVLAPWL